jgi:integrase/recombinase XerD
MQTIKKAWSVAATPYPKKTRPLPSILSPEEVAHLIDSSRTRFHRMVLMTLYGTAVRRAELTRLQIPDIALATMRLRPTTFTGPNPV